MFYPSLMVMVHLLVLVAQDLLDPEFLHLIILTYHKWGLGDHLLDLLGQWNHIPQKVTTQRLLLLTLLGHLSGLGLEDLLVQINPSTHNLQGRGILSMCQPFPMS